MFNHDSTYKFSTEGLITMSLDEYFILQQTELENFEKLKKNRILPNFNIYFILKRPKVTFNVEKTVISKKIITLEFFVQLKNHKEKRIIDLRNPFDSTNIKIDSSFPYSEFTIFNDENKFSYNCGTFLDEIQRIRPIEDNELDYEVLYIGQSFDENGKRDAVDRLKSHSTLQKIYSDSISKNPDSDIWLMLCNFQKSNIISINGLINSTESDENEEQRIMNFLKTNISEKQIINYTEAALIKTFKPKYNKEYKNSFPSINHQSYDECYKLDINTIIIIMEIDLNRNLYTSHKPRSENYFIFEQHLLVNSKDRYNFFFNEYL